jgi:hypothetical protein
MDTDANARALLKKISAASKEISALLETKEEQPPFPSALGRVVLDRRAVAGRIRVPPGIQALMRRHKALHDLLCTRARILAGESLIVRYMVMDLYLQKWIREELDRAKIKGDWAHAVDEKWTLHIFIGEAPR